MAKNLVAQAFNKIGKISPWYPNPDNEKKDWNFIYLNSLSEDHPQVYHKADNRLRDTFFRINEDFYPSLDSLYKLAQHEQQKEDEILNKIFGLNNGGAREDGQRIREFNKLYSYMPIFERNLEKIKTMVELGKGGRVDITASFSGYLESVFREELDKKGIITLNREDFLEITKKALIKAFESNNNNLSDNNQEIKAYQELANIVKSMTNSNDFIQEIFDMYFGNTFKKLEKEITSVPKQAKNIKVAKNWITKEKGIHGTLLEEVSELIMNTLSFDASGKAKRTTNKQKADVLNLYEATFEIPMELFENTGKGSVREQFIKRFEQFYKTMKDQQGYIIEVSAKNYNLSEKYFTEGFTAQGATTIENFQKMMKAYNYDKKKIDDLVFALTNIGPDTLETGTEVVSHSISLLIGYFLFDDIGMDFSKDLNVKAIHLFNLDGIYIPFSSFLFAAYESLKDFETLSRDVVSVQYTPQSIEYQKSSKDDPLTRQKWVDAVTKKQKQSSLSIHFFKNFPQYVAQKIK